MDINTTQDYCWMNWNCNREKTLIPRIILACTNIFSGFLLFFLIQLMEAKFPLASACPPPPTLCFIGQFLNKAINTTFIFIYEFFLTANQNLAKSSVGLYLPPIINYYFYQTSNLPKNKDANA